MPSKHSPHQKKVLLAILMLERAHGWKWWSADTIGDIVDAGGWHRTIQDQTIVAMREAGWIWRQCDTWTQEMIDEAPCCCAIHRFGLTALGRELASAWKFQATDRTAERIVKAKHAGCGGLHSAMATEQERRERRRRLREEREDDNA